MSFPYSYHKHPLPEPRLQFGREARDVSIRAERDPPVQFLGPVETNETRGRPLRVELPLYIFTTPIHAESEARGLSSRSITRVTSPAYIRDYTVW
jgi:hypothetical protein